MLEDVPGLINPIIQAMIATNRTQGEQADRAQRAEALKNEAAYKQAELKHQDAVFAETQRQHDQMMQYNTDMLNKVHIPQLQAQMQKEGLEALQSKIAIRGAGGDLNKLLPYGGQGGGQGPVDQNAGIPSQQEQDQRNADKLKAQAL